MASPIVVTVVLRIIGFPISFFWAEIFTPHTKVEMVMKSALFAKTVPHRFYRNIELVRWNESFLPLPKALKKSYLSQHLVISDGRQLAMGYHLL